MSGRILLAAVGVAVSGVAMAQSKPGTPSASATGTAGVAARLDTLHYDNVHGLRRGPDGQWVGKARQGGVEKSVTVTPQGTVIAR